jgi:ATP-dependent exoDNAse (exonuclease V) beta subunit
VHRWLERIAEEGLERWSLERVQSLRPRFEADLAHRGVRDATPAATLVAAALLNTLADGRGRWLLGAHPTACSERRLSTAERHLRIDRYIEDAGGTKWVVDFKTSEHAGGGLDAFLDTQQERYSAQLESYARAVGGARKALYFPLLKAWREW